MEIRNTAWYKNKAKQLNDIAYELEGSYPEGRRSQEFRRMFLNTLFSGTSQKVVTTEEILFKLFY